MILFGEEKSSKSLLQINMYTDQLEIINPGGLYGSTTVESLGKDGISSTPVALVFILALLAGFFIAIGMHIAEVFMSF